MLIWTLYKKYIFYKTRKLNIRFQWLWIPWSSSFNVAFTEIVSSDLSFWYWIEIQLQGNGDQFRKRFENPLNYLKTSFISKFGKRCCVKWRIWKDDSKWEWKLILRFRKYHDSGGEFCYFVWKLSVLKPINFSHREIF